MDKKLKIRRGDILYVDMGEEYEGSIQGGMRPMVVVSNNLANKFSPVITVVPLTSRTYKKRYLPTHVLISEQQCSGLNRGSIALCEQIMPINRSVIVERVGKVDDETLGKITEAVQIQVGVYEEYN